MPLPETDRSHPSASIRLLSRCVRLYRRCVTRAQVDGLGYHPVREAARFLLLQFALLGGKVVIVSDVTIWSGPVSTTDWGLCQDSECGLRSRGSRRGHLCTSSLRATTGDIQATQVHLYDFLMTHHSQPPLVLGEHKPWNHKMSIVRRISLRRRSSS